MTTPTQQHVDKYELSDLMRLPRNKRHVHESMKAYPLIQAYNFIRQDPDSIKDIFHHASLNKDATFATRLQAMMTPEDISDLRRDYSQATKDLTDARRHIITMTVEILDLKQDVKRLSSDDHLQQEIADLRIQLVTQMNKTADLKLQLDQQTITENEFSLRPDDHNCLTNPEVTERITVSLKQMTDAHQLALARKDTEITDLKRQLEAQKATIIGLEDDLRQERTRRYVHSSQIAGLDFSTEQGSTTNPSRPTTPRPTLNPSFSESDDITNIVTPNYLPRSPASRSTTSERSFRPEIQSPSRRREFMPPIPRHPQSTPLPHHPGFSMPQYSPMYVPLPHTPTAVEPTAYSPPAPRSPDSPPFKYAIPSPMPSLPFPAPPPQHADRHLTPSPLPAPFPSQEDDSINYSDSDLDPDSLSEKQAAIYYARRRHRADKAKQTRPRSPIHFCPLCQEETTFIEVKFDSDPNARTTFACEQTYDHHDRNSATAKIAETTAKVALTSKVHYFFEKKLKHFN